MKVITKDFQILKGTNEFEFPVGITIIQGKNASGKSSLFYAIKNCLTNPSGVADCINHEAKSCSVTVENNNTHVTWIKTPTSCEYVDDKGQKYVKASKLDSRDIADLGFYFDNKDNIVNIHDEWSVLFPYGQSDTDMFKMFEDIFNISCSFQIIDEIEKDIKERKAKISSINKQIDELTIQHRTIDQALSRIVSLPDLKLTAEEVEYYESYIKEIEQALQVYEQNDSIKQTTLLSEFNLTSLQETHDNLVQINEDYNSFIQQMEYNNIEVEEKSFDLQPPSILDEYLEYEDIQDRLIEFSTELQLVEEETIQIKNKLKEIKVCPTCGQELKYE